MVARSRDKEMFWKLMTKRLAVASQNLLDNKKVVRKNSKQTYLILILTYHLKYCFTRQSGE